MPETSTAATLQATARLLRAAADLLARRGVHRGFPGYVGDDGSLDVPAALLLAHTGRPQPPAEFTRAACLAKTGDPDRHFHTQPPVMAAIRFLSVCIDGAPNEDVDTGEPDYIDHLAWWPTYRPIGAQTHPTDTDVIDAMRKAADTADAIATADQPAAA